MQQDYKRLIVILTDQLSNSITSLKKVNKQNDTILMMENMQDATNVPHHTHKLVLHFAAMRHFAQSLKEKRYNVLYLDLEHKDNQHTLADNIQHMNKKLACDEIILTEPSEYYHLQAINELKKSLEIPIKVLSDNRFYCGIKEFSTWIANRKQPRMEHFYQVMRRKTGILMEDNKPIGGKFNYDASNRLALKTGPKFPKRLSITNDDTTQKVIKLVHKHFANHMGDPNQFNLAVTRKDALRLLNHFIKHFLPHFGDYQDAMLLGEYQLYHSNLSMYLNLGLLVAQEIVDKAEQAYFDQAVSLNNAEGFIRQILGWREYVRGLYWQFMPKYKNNNFLHAKQNLPDCYWSGDTNMTCIKHAVTQTIDTATSHHIQRLMVTGNFAMLLGVEPEQICDWYWAVYADAFEWVELPNTLGMSQFADGGILASKPYASSGNYINKMSDFCKNCHYKVNQKLTEDACPFNDLYWAFLIKNQKTLGNNMRLKFAYNHVNKMSDELKQQYLTKQKKLIKTYCK